MMRGAPPARNVDEVEALKREAGIAACSFVSSGMRLGLGTGSTVRYTVLEIGRRIAEEALEVIGVPTSEATRHLAEGLGIPLLSLEEAGELDLTIDGADEFDPDFQLIKGGGGALTREKRVAAASRAMVVVADESKQVPVLGEFDLPLEVGTDDWERVRDELDTICPGPVSLRGGQTPYLTDNGGYILDCEFGPTIFEPDQLEQLILSVEGVVEVGLFVGMCDAVVMATPSEVLTMVKQGGRLD
jgi:ribose 5-phosphate isomerase A